jgi:hypothetical protein
MNNGLNLSNENLCEIFIWSKIILLDRNLWIIRDFDEDFFDKLQKRYTMQNYA